MTQISLNTPSWRLLGGGGIILAGVAFTIGYGGILLDFVRLQSVDGELFETGLMNPLFIILIAAGEFVLGGALCALVSGDGGSDSAVVKSWWGKAAIVIAGLGWITLSLRFFAFDQFWAVFTESSITFVYLAVALAGIVGNIAIIQHTVVLGIARWALLALSIVTMIPVIIPEAWSNVLFAVTVLVSGILYLFNGRPAKPASVQ